jgi:hypothetical protein
MRSDHSVVPSFAHTLASLGDTTWVDDMIALMPRLDSPLIVAFDLAMVGHAEGWPYVRAIR